MNQMRREAEKAHADKLTRMGLKIRTADMGEDEGAGHVLPAQDGTQGKASGARAEGYKRGGRVRDNERSGARSRRSVWIRPAKHDERGKYARGGEVKGKKAGTTVNVIVAPSKPSLPMPMNAGAVPPVAGPGGSHTADGACFSCAAGAGNADAQAGWARRLPEDGSMGPAAAAVVSKRPTNTARREKRR